MAFCKKCGKQLEYGSIFCPTCGASQSEVNVCQPMDDEERDIRENKAMGILAYIGIFVLIPIFVAPNSKFARFHSNQGLLLFIAEVGLAVLQTIVNMAFPLFSALFFVRTILSLIIDIALLGVGVFAIIGIIYAAQGLKKELPFIGNISILK